MMNTGTEGLGGFKKNEYAGKVSKSKGLSDPHGPVKATTNVTGGPMSSAGGGERYPK